MFTLSFSTLQAGTTEEAASWVEALNAHTSPTLTAAEKVELSGTLHKQGEGNKAWAVRKFDLHMRRLDYFKENSSTPAGKIDLSEGGRVIDLSNETNAGSPTRFVFSINSSASKKSRNYLLCAQTAESFASWLKALRLVVGDKTRTRDYTNTASALSPLRNSTVCVCVCFCFLFFVFFCFC